VDITLFAPIIWKKCHESAMSLVMNCDLKKSNHGYHKDQLERFSIPNYQLDDLLEVPAAETHSQAEVVQTLAAAVEAITGTHPLVEGSGPACDGWMFITGGFLFRSCLFRDTMHKDSTSVSVEVFCTA
jgi:acetylornithine deacetylase/succinyl-diaminopimelate desuccinylase-like protein